MSQNPFEIPEQFRQMAEKGVEQARTAYGQLVDAMLQAQGMWAASLGASPMTAGFKSVQDRAVQYANENAKAALDHAADLARARDAMEIVSVQSRFAQSQMQTYAMQTQELTRLMTEAAQKMGKG